MNGSAVGSHRADLITTFASRDIDFVAERLTSLSGASTRVDYFSAPASFSMSLTAARLGSLLVSRVQVRGWSLTRPMEGLTNISIPINGTPLEYRCGAHSFEASARNFAAVGRPFETLRARFQEGAAIVFHAPIQALADRAEQLTAKSFSASLVSEMVDRVDLRRPAGEAFARVLKTTFTELDALNSAGLGPLAIAGYEDLLSNLAAVALFPSVAQRIDLSPAQCAPATIRRARDFIKANAAEPIKISSLAAELGLPMRTLQESFRRTFGLAPRAWLLECRLENARQSLSLPARGASVSAVAYDCGFADLSGFSARYRMKYGELPSETLRAARRRFS